MNRKPWALVSTEDEATTLTQWATAPPVTILAPLRPTQTPCAPEPDPMAWRDRANCLDMDPELFFPGKDEYWKAQAARAVCATCQVSADCLEFAIGERIIHGIWGGMSERERRRVRKERAA